MPTRLCSRIVPPALMLVVGAAAGLLVWVLSGDSTFQDWVGAGFPATGGVYPAGILTALLAARAWLVQHVPLRTWRSGAVHVLALCVVTEVVFFSLFYLDAALCTWLFGDASSADGGLPLTAGTTPTTSSGTSARAASTSAACSARCPSWGWRSRSDTGWKGGRVGGWKKCRLFPLHLPPFHLSTHSLSSLAGHAKRARRQRGRRYLGGARAPSCCSPPCPTRPPSPTPPAP